MKKVEINAEGKKLGRVASAIATSLMGKNSTTYARNKIPDIEVTVVNASKIEISDSKKDSKVYTHYTGYPGGLRKEKMGKLAERSGYRELVRKAVYGMLPGNKLRSLMMKKLIIVE